MAARSRIAALAVLALATACHDSQHSVPPTIDRFYYPTGLAVRQEPAGCIAGSDGCQSQLFVASSNFDLRYDPRNGGTMLSVDVAQALTGANGYDPNAAAGAFTSGALLGNTIIGSFAGEVAVVDQANCPGSSPRVLVASRAQDALYRLDLVPATGALSCGDALCGGANEVPLSTSLADAYGVTVVCGNPASGPLAGSHLAFVTFLRAQSSEGFLSLIDFDNPDSRAALGTTYDVGPGPTQSTTFDETRGLLFMSERFSAVGVAKLRWLDLTFPQLGVTSVDYGAVLRGAELVSLALSSDRSRIYLAARLYDVDTATTTGTRPVGDLGAALLVIDVNRALSGATAADTVLNVVHLDRGPVALVAIQRTGMRDLVALTSSDDGTMTLYDDELGATAAVFGVCDSHSTVPINRPRSIGDGGLAPDPCPEGNPTLGKQPYGIAWEHYQTATQTGLVRLFVGSFDRGWVNAIVLDPAHPDALQSWARIGPERQ